MLLVIDSSVVAKWLFIETLHEQAMAVRQDWESATVDLIAPDLMLVEVANIIKEKQRLGLITEEEATDATLDLLALEIPTVEPQAILVRAYSLAKIFERTVYDALYLALADERGARFVTADMRLYNAVSSGLGFVQYLGSYVKPESP
jgi:predicted nucleic acid-binding protein